MKRPLALALLGILAASCRSQPASVVAPPLVAAPPPPVLGMTLMRSSRPEPRVRLTAGDGTGLELVKLTANAVVQQPLALTELRMEFENPTDRTLEGTFRFTVPQGAALSRFAMKTDGVWREGEVVELASARRAYEDFLHRKQDPALLEQSSGSEFSARVFPIPAHSRKELVVAYSQEIDAGGNYELPLKGLPTLKAMDVSISRQGARAPDIAFHRDNAPPEDLSLPSASSTDGLRADGLALVRVRPTVAAAPSQGPMNTLVLVDTSASRALGFADELEAVSRVVETLSGAHAKVEVVAFDQDVSTIYEGDATAFGAEERKRLETRGALGASDLAHALGWAKGQASTGHYSRVVLVTDGVATAGAVESNDLVAAAKALGEAGVSRLDAVTVGGIRDDADLRRMVTAGLPQDGVIADGQLDARSLALKLTRPTQSGIAVTVPGATWSWPRTLDGVQPGDERTIYVELPKGAPLTVQVGTQTTTPNLVPAERPLLERAWAQAKISSLQDALSAPQADTAALRKQMVDVSTKYRVTSPVTAMLVLEHDSDYARFNLDRKALSDILSVDGGQVAVLHRAQPDVAVATGDAKNKGEEGKMGDPTPDQQQALREAAEFGMIGILDTSTDPPATATGNAFGDEIGDSFGAGGLGLSGAGEGGGGRGEGIGLGSIGTLGHGAGSGGLPAPTSSASPGSGQGYGMGHGRLGGGTRYGVQGPQDEARREAPASAHPYTGRFETVMSSLAKGDFTTARKTAIEWRTADPGDVMALVALGEVAENGKDLVGASRAYGSIIDLFPNRADMRRFAGERLERVSAVQEKEPSTGDAALRLAIDSYEKALAQRADHPSSHRLVAYAELRNGNYERALEVAIAASKREFPSRYGGVPQLLKEDVGLIAAAWIKADPKRTEEILAKVKAAGAVIEDKPSLRFILNWETDANDVDFHIYDSAGNHAYYGHKQLESGGSLYADITTGYGPECFTIRAPRSARSSYKLQANYYSRGPMGYGMGKLEVIEHDGKGGLTIEERPYVVMVDHAFVDLGTAR